MTLEQALALLKRQCEKAGGQASWAKQHNMSAPYVSDVLAGRRDPGEKVLTALGLVKTIIYRKVK